MSTLSDGRPQELRLNGSCANLIFRGLQKSREEAFGHDSCPTFSHSCVLVKPFASSDI